MPAVKDRLCVAKLQILYTTAVQSRSHHRVPKPKIEQIEQIAQRLGDPRLCDLFVEAQFWKMPEAFCLQTFGVSYPPANVCFGGAAWDRYQEYLNNGSRVPIQKVELVAKKVTKKIGKKVTKVSKKVGKKVSIRAVTPPKTEKETRFAALATALKSARQTNLSSDELELFTASKVQLPVGYLSPSAIDTYLRCPLQYKFQYIDKLRSPPAVALEEGSSHHFALETNNKHKIHTGKDLPVKQCIEAFKDDFSPRIKTIEDWGGDNANVVMERGASIIKTYHAQFAPKLQPTHSERAFAVRIGSIPVVGFIDVIGVVNSLFGSNAPLTVIDYKTVSKAKTQSDVESSLQLSSYADVAKADDPRRAVRVGFCSLVKSTGRVQFTDATADAGRIAWYRRVVVMVANQISLGNFPACDPNSWNCSARFCGAWKHCRGAVQAGQPAKLTVSAPRREDAAPGWAEVLND